MPDPHFAKVYARLQAAEAAVAVEARGRVLATQENIRLQQRIQVMARQLAAAAHLAGGELKLTKEAFEAVSGPGVGIESDQDVETGEVTIRVALPSPEGESACVAGAVAVHLEAATEG